MQLTLNASFEKMIPRSHPYIQNYLEQPAELRGLGNSLRIVVENPHGDIYDPKYLDDAASHPRRAVPDAGRGPRLGEVAVDAGRALDRGDRGRLPRRPGDARQLRRLESGHRAAARQHRALRHRRQPGRQRLQVQHDRRAAARQRPDHRPAHRLPRAVACASRRSAPATKRRATRRRAHPRDRLRQAGRRPDRRPGAGGAVLRPGRADRRGDHLPVHALRAQHRAGDRLLAGRGGLAARPGGRLRLRARSLLDPRALPGLRHRREPRRAEDERHHAGHRPRRAPAGGGALHLPPPVPGRPDRAAGRRGRLRGADGDRHPGHQGPGADRQPRRRGADLHQPDPAAGAAVVRRRQPGGGRSAACAPTATKPAASGFNRIFTLLERFVETRWATGGDRWRLRRWPWAASSSARI